MSRRTVWIALAVIVVATAGFLIAVLVPRNSDELPPPAVIVEKTITIPPGEPAARHSTDQVKRAFGRAGLPMKTALRIEDGKVVYPKGGELVYSTGGKVPDMIVLDPSAGAKFVVYVYPSSTYAARFVRTSPVIDPVRGLRRTMLRDANVVVIVEPPRSNLERRIRQILETL